jgi:hypothetical protein
MDTARAAAMQGRLDLYDERYHMLCGWITEVASEFAKAATATKDP